MATIHITRGTTSLGTFSEEEVREGLRSGRFALTDLAWREGMATWEALSKWPEFGGTTSSAASATSPIAPSISVAPAAPVTPQSGLPWDSRHSRGFFPAFFDTLVMVLTKPAEAFTAMKREGGFGEPLIYALVGGCLGYAVFLLFMLLMPSLAMFGNKEAFAGAMGMSFGIFFAIIVIPLCLAIGLFIGSGILHLCLMLVGGAKQAFETTFRVVCFAVGSTYPLIIVPFCGSSVAGIWAIVVECIGLARAHETDTGRAVLAVFLPLIVCCGGGFLILMMFGAIGAMSHHGN